MEAGGVLRMKVKLLSWKARQTEQWQCTIMAHIRTTAHGLLQPTPAIHSDATHHSTTPPSLVHHPAQAACLPTLPLSRIRGCASFRRRLRASSRRPTVMQGALCYTPSPPVAYETSSTTVSA